MIVLVSIKIPSSSGSFSRGEKESKVPLPSGEGYRVREINHLKKCRPISRDIFNSPATQVLFAAKQLYNGRTPPLVLSEGLGVG
jgi:hypothetical protein